MNEVVSYGTRIGETGEGHLHLGVRTESKFHNPLYFFTPTRAGLFVARMSGYIQGEGPWSMRAYTYSSGECQNYFWGDNPDRTGIDR